MPGDKKKKKEKSSKSRANSSESQSSSYAQDDSNQGGGDQEFADKIANSDVNKKEQDWADKMANPDDDWAHFTDDENDDENDDWAHFTDDENDESNSEEVMDVVNVGIGKHEVASNNQKLFTKDLADCVAVVGYTDEGEAAMYHVNIPAQCYCIAEEEEWDHYLSEIAGQYAKVKSDLEKALQKGGLSYQFVVGGTWDYVREKPDSFKNGAKWIEMMNGMFQETFKSPIKDCSKSATWNPKTKQLTPG
jgi:hypothetical protein